MFGWGDPARLGRIRQEGAMRKSRKLLVGAGIGVIGLIVAGTAWAVTSSFNGTGISHLEMRTDVNPFTTTSLTYVNVPGATATVSVPANAVVRSRFSGES